MRRKIEPLVLPNGVVVPPSLRITEMTLREHQNNLDLKNLRPLTFEEAVQIHGRDEAEEYFGKDGGRQA